MEKMFRIYPDNGKYIPDVLPNGKKIENVTDMPLNRAEFLKCKAYATICALVGEPPKEVIVNTKTYEEAVAVFNGMKDTVICSVIGCSILSCLKCKMGSIQIFLRNI